MAIGLSNVETRKVKKSATKRNAPETPKPTQKSRMATVLIENSAKALDTLTTTQPVPREQKMKSNSSGELNSLWMVWSNQVAGVESESLVLTIARQWMELEQLVFDIVKENLLKELHKTAFGLKINERVQRARS